MSSSETKCFEEKCNSLHELGNKEKMNAYCTTKNGIAFVQRFPCRLLLGFPLAICTGLFCLAYFIATFVFSIQALVNGSASYQSTVQCTSQIGIWFIVFGSFGVAQFVFRCCCGHDGCDEDEESCCSSKTQSTTTEEKDVEKAANSSNNGALLTEEKIIVQDKKTGGCPSKHKRRRHHHCGHCIKFLVDIAMFAWLIYGLYLLFSPDTTSLLTMCSTEQIDLFRLIVTFSFFGAIALMVSAGILLIIFLPIGFALVEEINNPSNVGAGGGPKIFTNNLMVDEGIQKV